MCYASVCRRLTGEKKQLDEGAFVYYFRNCRGIFVDVMRKNANKSGNVRNIEERSSNRSLKWKSKQCFLFRECVCSLCCPAYLAHSPYVLPSVACLALPYFSKFFSLTVRFLEKSY